MPPSADTYRELNLFGDVFERVRSDYVETPDETQLIESAINGMLAGLDPHSSYLSPKNFKDMQVQTSGKFGGLGIEVTMEDGVIKVVSPIDDTPAARAGILANDLIIALDGEVGRGHDPQRGGREDARPDQHADHPHHQARQCRKAVRRQARPRGDHHPFGALAPRKATSAISASPPSTSRPSTGSRRRSTSIDAEIGIDKVKGYVIDLRNNPGGLLDQAIAVSDAFLDRGEIVSTRGRHAEETQRYNAHAGDLADGKPVIVLVNGGSASASEIVAGALQDHRRATILGTRSFGKGSVQTIIPLGANGALRLTTARYYTPSGRSIQAKGIDPDIEVIQELPPDLRRPGQRRAARRGKPEGPPARARTPRGRARSNRARSPMSRRTRRTTSSSTTRSTC